MDQQVSFVTVSTVDLDAARRFSVDGLGWRPLVDVPGEVVFFQVAPGTVLGFFDAVSFEADLESGRDPAPVSGLTLAHNVGSRDEVAVVVEAMAAAGGVVTKTPREGAFGGVFHAHVRDPNGVVWEVAHNPGWHVAPDGAVSFDRAVRGDPGRQEEAGRSRSCTCAGGLVASTAVKGSVMA